MRNKILMVLMLLFTLSLAGCKSDNKLNEDAIALYQVEFNNPDNEDDGYMALQYINKFYVPYGVINKTLNDSKLKENIGYVFNEYAPDDKSMRVYSLVDTDDFIVEIPEVRFMNEPMFYRSLDTKNEEIVVPDYIKSLDYEIWNEK